MSTVLFLSHTPRCSPFKVGSYHLSRELALAGHRVMHVSAPVTPLHALYYRDAVIASRLRCWWRAQRDADGTLDVVPAAVMPWGAFTVGGKPSPWFFLPHFRRLLARHGFADGIDLVLIDEPRFVSVLPHLRARRIIYRATDLYADMRADERIVAIERDVCRRADSLIGTSGPVCSWLRKQAPDKPVHLLENGVQLESFLQAAAPPQEYAAFAGPIVLYVGALDERFGFEALRAAATALPALHFVIVGPPPNEPPPLPANVHLLGARPYEQIPAYLQHADIGLMPLSPHPANNGRSPMKLYEYAAAGLPVAASETVELRRRQLPFVHLAAADDFAAAVKAALAQAQKNQRASIKQFASEASWSSIARHVLRIANPQPAVVIGEPRLPLGAQA